MPCDKKHAKGTWHWSLHRQHASQRLAFGPTFAWYMGNTHYRVFEASLHFGFSWVDVRVYQCGCGLSEDRLG